MEPQSGGGKLKATPHDAVWTAIGPRARAGLLRLQARARGRHVRKAWGYLRTHNNPMSRWAFVSLAVFFVAAKVELTLVLLAALSDTFTDFATPPPTAATAAHKTPFQQHPHNWGVLFQILVLAHVVTGTSLVVSMLVPLFTEKGGRWHRAFGRLFATLWVFHMTNGLWNASTVILNRGYHEDLYPAEGEGFSLHLFLQFGFVAGVQCEYLVAGLAATQYKLAPPRALRSLLVAMSATSAAHCAAMVALAIYTFANWGASSATACEYAIIFALDFPVYLFQSVKNWMWHARTDPTYALFGWPVEHQRNMMFTANFTLITGVANVTFRIAPWATVALFATQEVSWVVWIMLKERALKRSLAAAFTVRRNRARATALSAALLLQLGARTGLGAGKGAAAAPGGASATSSTDGGDGDAIGGSGSVVLDVAAEVDATEVKADFDDADTDGEAAAAAAAEEVRRSSTSGRQWRGHKHEAQSRGEYLMELARRAHNSSHHSLVEV
mmetsp:Transcript_19009/g.67123  ORF Transcript_19009/g.67123 Transcript_19009/m.67123 type:complete len:499 (-) Transcript_19009:292-1788(-)